MTWREKPAALLDAVEALCHQDGRWLEPLVLSYADRLRLADMCWRHEYLKRRYQHEPMIEGLADGDHMWIVAWALEREPHNASELAAHVSLQQAALRGLMPAMVEAVEAAQQREKDQCADEESKLEALAEDAGEARMEHRRMDR